MARYVLLSLALLALCAGAYAQIWPAGVPGGEELAEIAANQDKASVSGTTKYKYKSKHGHKKKSKKSGEDHSPYYKTREADSDPFGDYPNAAPDHGKHAYNHPSHHVWEHIGPCIGSNKVKATGPLNAECPPANVVNQTPVKPCKVPAYCEELPGGIEPCTCPQGEFLRFDADQAGDHFRNQPGPFPMVDSKRSTYECVDARGFGPMIATPGGDLAELMAACMAMLKLRGISWDKKMADRMFQIFADEIAHPGRPLYFHTDDIRLRAIFKELKGKLKGEPPGYMPSILPFKAPSNKDDVALWLNALIQPQFQGCGHVRLMLQDNTKLEFSVSLTSEDVQKCPSVDSACVSSKQVGQYMIEKFFRYWWPTPSGSEQREKIAFEVDGILQGPLLGKGVAVISNTPKDACPDHAPAIRPAFGGSQMFLYHGDAVHLFREYVSKKYFKSVAEEYKITWEQLLETWNAVATQGLTATLVNLSPANRVGQFSIEVPTMAVEYEYADKDDDKYDDKDDKYDDKDDKYEKKEKYDDDDKYEKKKKYDDDDKDDKYEKKEKYYKDDEKY